MTALALGACGWLDAHAPADGRCGLRCGKCAGWPHAPWLVPEDGGPASLITTGLLAGTLHARGVRHPWLDRATELLWARIGELAAAGPYDMRAVAAFPRSRARPGPGGRKAMDRLGPLITSQDLVTLDPGTRGDPHPAGLRAACPGRWPAACSSPRSSTAHLDHLAGAQRDDGGWTFNWMAWSPAAEPEWRGAMTVNALHLLRANGRC